jgi:hypothetical protein
MDSSTMTSYAEASQDGGRNHTALPYVIHVNAASPGETSDWLSEHSDAIKKHDFVRCLAASRICSSGGAAVQRHFLQRTGQSNALFGEKLAPADHP